MEMLRCRRLADVRYTSLQSRLGCGIRTYRKYKQRHELHIQVKSAQLSKAPNSFIPTS
jgi:hypothetical protein